MSPEARAARERKQKIFVVVGGIALLALLAIQLPRILGGNSAQTAAPAESATAPEPGTAPAGAEPAALPTGSSSATRRPTFTSLSLFSKKDPFVQQVRTDTSEERPGGASGQPTGEQQKSAAKEATKGFTLGGKPAASVTLISVNGARQAVVAGAAFPSTDPVFVLVAEHPGQKSVTIAVAGGAYANGATKTKLRVGKPLVLVNTTTGAQYRIVLVAVGSGAQAAPADSGTDKPATQP